jgi:hypothetical protein
MHRSSYIVTAQTNSIFANKTYLYKLLLIDDGMNFFSLSCLTINIFWRVL